MNPRSLAFTLFRTIVSGVGGRGLGVARLPGVLPVYRYLYKRLRPSGLVLVDVMGHRMYVDPSDSTISAALITTGGWEKRETDILTRALRPGMTVLDIGAHIGYYTLTAARLVGPSGRVVAFEPEARNHALLVKNVELNGYANVTALAAVVAEREGRRRLHLDVGPGGHSLSERNIYGTGGSVEVDAVTLDGLRARGVLGPRVDVIKIDVQGAEGLVWQGGARLLAHDRPAILMELEPAKLRPMGTDPLAMLRAFADAGYTIRAVDDRVDFEAVIPLERMVTLAEEAGTINVFMTVARPGAAST